MKMRIKLFIIILMTTLSIGDIAEHNTTTYRALVDGYYGFIKVINSTTGETVDQNHTVNITIGDKIVWINEDQTDKITIISEQGLWENNTAILPHTDSQFNYTFNDSGIYSFNMGYEDYPKLIVIVSGISADNHSQNIANISLPTANKTDNIGTNATGNKSNTENTTNTTENTTNTTENMTNTTENMTNTTETTNITENTTNITENTTNITENTTNITDTGVADESNIVNNEDDISINPLLTPLNISSNIKITGFISFIVVMIIFFIRD